jgi:hypothetical protein
MPTLAEVLKFLESLPLADLLAFAERVEDLIAHKQTADAVKAGEAAADLAADAAENAKFPRQ